MAPLSFVLLLSALFQTILPMEKVQLYRFSTSSVSFGNFVRNPFRYLWEKKEASSMVTDQSHCALLCVSKPKCYSFNMAVYPDSKGLHRCELLATDKYRATQRFQANLSYHYYYPWSPCEQAPCMNGGVCVPEYESNSYHCECQLGFCGTDCEQGGNKTCSEIKLCNLPDGSYVIDPDGEGGVNPFEVYCDMTDKNGVGVTIVSHDSERRTLVHGFEGKGTYSRNVEYDETDLVQLESLTSSSTNCEQFIKYECYHAKLFFNGAMNSWWMSRGGEKMTYWGGVDSIDYKCVCGLTNSCADPSDGCNCDKNDRNWREDSGLLTDKSKLPVTQLRFGDTGGFGDTVEKGYHTLGKLKCYGLNHDLQ